VIRLEWSVGTAAVGRKLLAQDPDLLPVQSPAVSKGERKPCPYKGPSRYDVADADLFVGRERLRPAAIRTAS